MEDKEPTGVKSVMDGRFLIKEKLGGGSFGTIYRGEDTLHPDDPVAIKVGNKPGGNSALAKEARILAELSDGFGFPKLLYFGKERRGNVMVISLLGHDLEKAYLGCNYRFSLKTVLMLADQMLTRIEYLHSKGFVHRDIKPENFLLGRNHNAKNIYMIDFGLSKQWRDPGGGHAPYKEGKGLVGTARYASCFTHEGIEQSRRDDLESVGYVLIYFLKGRLPWQNLRCESGSDQYSAISDVKHKTPLSKLCEGLPREFEQYLTYVRGLGFTEAPNYKHLKKLFRRYFVQHGFDYDYNYDWVTNAKLVTSTQGNGAQGANAGISKATETMKGSQTNVNGADGGPPNANNKPIKAYHASPTPEEPGYFRIADTQNVKSNLATGGKTLPPQAVPINSYTIRVSEVESPMIVVPQIGRDKEWDNLSKRVNMSGTQVNFGADEEIPTESVLAEPKESLHKTLIRDIVQQSSFTSYATGKNKPISTHFSKIVTRKSETGGEQHLMKVATAGRTLSKPSPATLFEYRLGFENVYEEEDTFAQRVDPNVSVHEYTAMNDFSKQFEMHQISCVKLLEPKRM